MKKKSIKRGKELMQIIITKAWENETFKKELINKPVATFEKATGVKMTIPEGFKFVVEDQTDPNIIYLNIPRQIEIDDYELDDEELEKVSGGAACGGLCVLAIIGAIAALDYIQNEVSAGWNDYK